MAKVRPYPFDFATCVGCGREVNLAEHYWRRNDDGHFHLSCWPVEPTEPTTVTNDDPTGSTIVPDQWQL